jgi:hypothetical protein
MLGRIRKAFFKGKEVRHEPLAAGALAAWAVRQGLVLDATEDGRSFTLQGKLGQLTWQLERGAPSRSFITGSELRGRTALGIHPDVALLVLNRPLKDTLEHMAFSQFTDSLRTGAESNLPEEVRWLSMYEEAQLHSAPIGFDDLYAVMAGAPEHARQWVTAGLATELMRWPASMEPQTPVVLMVFRGNVYMRMQYAYEDLQILEQAARIYGLACMLASQGLPRG